MRGLVGIYSFFPDDSGVGNCAVNDGDDNWKAFLARNVGDRISFRGEAGLPVLLTIMLLLLLLAAKVLAAKSAPKDFLLISADNGDRAESVSSASSEPDKGESETEPSEQIEPPGEN